MDNFNLKKYLTNNPLLNEIKIRNPLNDQPITIIFTPESFTQTWDPGDFDSNEEWDKFRNKLKSDENFAYKTFFDNFNDFGDAINRQNDSNWKIEIK